MVIGSTSVQGLQGWLELGVSVAKRAGNHIHSCEGNHELCSHHDFVSTKHLCVMLRITHNKIIDDRSGVIINMEQSLRLKEMLRYTCISSQICI